MLERDLARKRTEEIEASIALLGRLIGALTASGKDTTDAKKFLELLIRCRVALARAEEVLGAAD